MVQLCEAQHDLNGAHFLWLEKQRQKIAGVEGGKAATKIISKQLSTSSQIAAQRINFIDFKI